MHLGSIKQPYGIVSPSWSICIQSLHQLSHKLCKCILAIVSLQKGKESVTKIINSHYHGYPWVENIVSLRLLLVVDLPGISQVIGLTKPSLIYSQYPLALEQHVNKLNRKLLSHVLVS